MESNKQAEMGDSMTAEIITLRDGSDLGRQLPPPGMNDNLTLANETPGFNAGSFSYEPQTYYPEGIDTRPRAPQCEETGIPLLIAPSKDAASLASDQKSLHHLVYPKTHPLLQGIVGRALKLSRMQVLPNTLHNDGSETAFHTLYGDGIVLPETPEEKLGFILLCLTRYMPDTIVDTTGGDTMTRRMYPWERRYFSSTNEPVPVKYEDVTVFRNKSRPNLSLKQAKDELLALRGANAKESFAGFHHSNGYVVEPIRDFVLAQSVSELNKTLMRKFMLYGEPEIGMTLLEHAAKEAANRATIKGRAFAAVYGQMRNDGRISDAMPVGAPEFVVAKLGTPAGRMALLPVLQARLKRHHDLIA